MRLSIPETLSIALALMFGVAAGRSQPAPTPGCDDSWTATSTTNAPSARSGPTAVWTGNGMIVWGGNSDGTGLNTGGTYYPATDSWDLVNTLDAPSGRDDHTAVWTGSEMIVWGGGGPHGTITGGRYNRSTDTWRSTTLTNAPTERIWHTAVWTQKEMIVWGGASFDIGGFFHYLSSGGRYDPATDSWIATAGAGSPSRRDFHTAVWTGSEMIVWGGAFESAGVQLSLNTGGRYNPTTNTWMATATTDAPTGRLQHTAVWTGSEMIVWGGLEDIGVPLDTGGRYDPVTDTWTTTSVTNAPSARFGHTAVWTGSEMIIWGGLGQGNSPVNTGGRYNPATDTWTITNNTNAPELLSRHCAVWTGSEMVVWGGNSLVNTGGRYCARSMTPTRALNISTRMRVDTGNNVLISGFIVTGASPKNMAVRGMGPSLGSAGVPEALANPILELHGSDGALILANDDWQSDPGQAKQLSNLGLGLPNPEESGFVSLLQPGSYTAILAGADATTGVGLLEVYDANQAANSRLANISTRGLVLTENNVMIGGFLLGGSYSSNVAVRAIGPSLVGAGITDFLNDPSLELRDSNGALLIANDNWEDDPDSAAQLTAHSLGLQDPMESGIFATLAPGAFTAILAGKNGGVGIGLVEIYVVE